MIPDYIQNKLHVKKRLNIYKRKIHLDFMEVKKIRREGNQLKITIPKRSNYKAGDYIIFEKLNSEVAIRPSKIAQPSSPLQNEQV